MIPQEINSFLEYEGYQDALWKAYDSARRSLPRDSEGVQCAQTLSALSGIYDKLMRHLEGAYYRHKRSQRLLPQEIEALRIKLLSND